MTRKTITRNLMILQATGMISFPLNSQLTDMRDFKQKISSFVIDEEDNKITLLLKSGFSVNEERENYEIKISEAKKFFIEIFKQFSPEEGIAPVFNDDTPKSELPFEALQRKENPAPPQLKPQAETVEPKVAAPAQPQVRIDKPLHASNGKTIGDVRDALFATLKDLREDKIDVKKAKAVSSISQTILNSAKIEMEYKRLTGGSGEIKLLEE